ncbi:39S ribosomal protein L32, mitochondrial-like [Patiria miniata]|uniref:Large ribosomal subunit protein bL32m n=1 Tax=Patiria miniata TaxID=46514 RepID=A0A914A3X7_PATMI|nr:39S ribosomal protein L32, mitochondrial-like [Patiria miniata]
MFFILHRTQNKNMNKSALVIRILQRIQLSFKHFELTLWEGYGGHPPVGPALAIDSSAVIPDRSSESGGGLASIFDGLLWAVPKHRRSIQRNRTRRRAEDKMIKHIPEEKFTTCEVCGHAKMIGFLCGHCLIRIRQETREIRKQLMGQRDETDALPDRETVVVYEGEPLRPEEEGKEIVEMKKKRPSWFSRALLE